MRRRMERDAARSERIEGKALKAADVMPEGDRKRLRVEPNSDRILKLEATYRQAQRDLKLRLTKPSLPEPEDAGSSAPLGIWDLVFKLTWLAPSSRHAKIWAALILYNGSLRARGKGDKTSPELKALLDFLTEHGFLCYDRATRVYRSAPCYREAVRLMRRMEMDVLNQLIQLRRPIRDR